MAEQNDRNILGTAEWGRGFVEELARETLKERKAKRRWRIFQWLAFLAVLAFGIQRCTSVAQVDEDQRRPASYVASINIEGVIVGGSGEEGVSADRVNKALRRAFADPRAVGVVLRINSPGGSPVQSGMIVDEMRRQRRLHPEKPLHAVIEEIGASGGYYIAAAADNIYVDKASIVGSIGVLLSNYGVQDTLKMLGIERRTQTAGKNKAFMDPTAPISGPVSAASSWDWLMVWGRWIRWRVTCSTPRTWWTSANTRAGRCWPGSSGPRPSTASGSRSRPASAARSRCCADVLGQGPFVGLRPGTERARAACRA